MNVMEFLRRNVQPATGCTEPIAVGYATSLAFHSLFNDLAECDGSGDFSFKNKLPTVELDKIVGISIKTDRDVYKNALAVVIPGTGGLRGILIAAAMGLFCDPIKKLNIFSDIGIGIVEKAKKIVESGKISLEKVTDMGDKPKLDISVSIEYEMDGGSDRIVVRLQDTHTNVTQIDKNGRIVYGGSRIAHKEELIFPESIEEFIDIIQSLTQIEKDEIYKGVVMNKGIAGIGINGNYGLGVGKALRKISKKTGSTSSMIDEIKITAAAAADARMGGAPKPVMSTGGSGNQGITAIIPIAVAGEMKGINRDRICEAVMLSHLVVSLSKKYSGDLSAVCGCAIKAGMGASAGLAYLLGGNADEIHAAINLLAGNITGTICDGAKEGCALKLATAAGAATESALMALQGIRIPTDNGIVYENSVDTIKALGRISYSMVLTDLEIIRVMQSKSEKEDHQKDDN